MAEPARKFSPQFKAEAVQLVIQTGRPVAEIARELQVNESTLGNWVLAWRRENTETGDGAGKGMTPVEHARTVSASTPSASAATAVAASASSSPTAPVPAFACPLFTRTARAVPFCSLTRESSTGAAANLFVVNSPATLQTSPATSSARSGRPLFFSPAVTPAARNPDG